MVLLVTGITLSINPELDEIRNIVQGRLGRRLQVQVLKLALLPQPLGVRLTNRRNVTSGSLHPLLFPSSASYDPAHATDPTHPAARWKTHAFPNFCCTTFTLRVAPKDALLRLEFKGRVLVQRSTTVSRGIWKDCPRM
ncbi:uncharacterized protein BJ212DRAFT_1295186 [Suillus subaureus]|uniref:Uncharacterized protein n=1 Tax=Suillus subaureus TaxID=48587 RepID=A0A9P7ENH4_9AGAM|nr:uncharacterized protein BJ212DRAFT_1295186 [Suillus subaureus]KAG1825847.1 hypothetical protein BJ212DRAFT_1295186 [Suillus subaureus]